MREAAQPLPHATELEQSIIASLLLNPETAENVFDALTANDFYHTKHQIVFQTIHGLFLKDELFDLTSVVISLRNSGLIEQIGGAAYVSRLVDCPVPSSVAHYCAKIIDLSERRQLMIGLSEVMQDTADIGKDIEAIREKINTINNTERRTKSRVPSVESLLVSDDEWNGASLTPTCIVQDLLYADVATLAAPGGTGKTTLCLFEYVHIVLNRRLYGLDVKKPGWCLFITSEDSKERLIARLREIVKAMGLSDHEKVAIRRGILFWDVSGDEVRLISLEDGNIVLTTIADEIVRAYKDDPPVIVTFDPIISFGVGESRVNDNEQGLITAARRIRNGLNCAVRLIHHTGKINAREKSLDQYAARGGSALPDGSRMVTILQGWDPKNNTHRPPHGCTPSIDASITILARPKLSYAHPNLSLIWIKRTGWTFEYFTETYATVDERDRALLNQVERFIAAEEKAGIYHSKNSLDSKHNAVGITRQELRDTIEQLIAAGRIVKKDLPPEHKHGGRKTYLAVREKTAGYSEVGKNEQFTSPDNIAHTAPPPHRDRFGGEVEPPKSSPLPRPRREGTAGFGEVGGVDTKFEPIDTSWEVEI